MRTSLNERGKKETNQVIGVASPLKACKDCAYIHIMPSPLPVGAHILCKQCGCKIHKENDRWAERSVALSITALVLFLIANISPFIGLDAAGIIVQSNLLSGVFALIQRDLWLLSFALFLFIFLIPLIELSCFFYISFSYYFLHQKKPRGITRAIRTISLLHPWSMMDIFLLGVLVTAVKLGNLATILPGPGSIAFLLLVLTLAGLRMQLNHDSIWRWIDKENLYLAKDQMIEFPSNSPNETSDFISCEGCDALISKSLIPSHKECPRCGDKLHLRIPNSLEKSLALLLAGIILYIPANLLPIMTTTQLGKQSSDTIMSGVIHLVHLGSWPIAAVVFIASIVVPITKIFAMGYLLYSAHYGNRNRIKKHTSMYRIVEFVGRWSMVDVFVVCILVAMVQFGVLANIEPREATLAFASVVVLTMLSAEIFDQRLLWDNKNG